MIKLRFIPLAALALAIGSTTSMALPKTQAMSDARSRLAAGVATGQYMRLDASSPGCTDRVDGGENRFDRMYDGIGGRAC
ncbi:MAG TPA: hypothetical protein VF641_08260, partial [Methylobacterium sp.]